MRVVVIGGGFAGFAAAVALQENRHQVTLLERRGILGGRATSYPDAVSGEDVDNGTHVMIAGYRSTLDLLRRAGAMDLVQIQDDLRIDYVDARGFSALACPRLPAPWHLLAGILGLRLPMHVRLEAARLGLAVRFGRPPHGITLAEYLRRTGQSSAARELLWDPLAIAILNETPERSAAVLFFNVYREAFLSTSRASRLVFLRRGFGVLLSRLGAYLQARGGSVRRRARVEGIEVSGQRALGVRFRQSALTREDVRRARPARLERLSADAIVAAVPWHTLPSLLPEELRGQQPFLGLSGIAGSPIVSVEMWLDRMVVERPMLGLRDSEVQWVFDKGRLYGRRGAPQHLAFIVSAAYRSSPKPNAELVGVAEAALRRYFPAMAGVAVTRALVLREPDATFASDPAAEGRRPGPGTPIEGLYLAGDWTATGLPATIEGAVRSGRAAAEAVEAQARRAAGPPG